MVEHFGQHLNGYFFTGAQLHCTALHCTVLLFGDNPVTALHCTAHAAWGTTFAGCIAALCTARAAWAPYS